MDTIGLDTHFKIEKGYIFLDVKTYTLDLKLKTGKNHFELWKQKNSFSKIENVLFLARPFGISKRLGQAFQNFSNRFETFQNDFWKTPFCPSLARLGVDERRVQGFTSSAD